MNWHEKEGDHDIVFSEEGSRGVEAVLAKCLTCSVDLGRYDKQAYSKYRLAVAALRLNARQHALDTMSKV